MKNNMVVYFIVSVMLLLGACSTQAEVEKETNKDNYRAELQENKSNDSKQDEQNNQQEQEDDDSQVKGEEKIPVEPPAKKEEAEGPGPVDATDKGLENIAYPDAVYQAMAKSRDRHGEATKDASGLVYKLQIRNDQLVVWGSMDVFVDGSDEAIYLEDEMRIFPLADDFRLGLEWVGSMEEQIAYFNETGADLNAYAMLFTVEDGQVVSIGFAG